MYSLASVLSSFKIEGSCKRVLKSPGIGAMQFHECRDSPEEGENLEELKKITIHG